MDLFTYLMAKKGQNTQRDLFSYLLGKEAGGSGTYVNFTGTSLNISNTLRARIKNITLKGATSQDGTPTPEAPIPIKVVTGEQNVQIGTTNYPLSLGNMELAEITENYQDYIYGTPNNWYKKSLIGKVVLDGSESWSLVSSETNTTRFYVNISTITNGLTDTTPPKLLASHFTPQTFNYIYRNDEECIAQYGGTTDTSRKRVYIRINNSLATTLVDFKTWLSTHNTTVYYVLATPTNEQITDTTLITQLNNLYNATSQEGATYITCSSASDSNEIIVFSGDVKVASVGLGNPLNTSLLSSNIQEETNIDDIQEEPNVDEVNEIEDIEQNEEPIEEEVS